LLKRQAETVRATTVAIMRTAAFREGVDDARQGRPPRFDRYDHNNWDYERGRLFAHIAPLSMALRIDGRLNSQAIALFNAAWERGFII
jgi:hypothetical protein